jgi:hypothetical protein
MTQSEYERRVMRAPRSSRRSPQEQADDFMAANDKSPVVAGFAIGQGGQGGVYKLKDGTRHRIGAKGCGLLREGYPRWVHDPIPTLDEVLNSEIVK